MGLDMATCVLWAERDERKIRPMSARSDANILDRCTKLLDGLSRNGIGIDKVGIAKVVPDLIAECQRRGLPVNLSSYEPDKKFRNHSMEQEAFDVAEKLG